MSTDNYTKEEREFYESIMQEIRSHQDFWKRNPVDIGIECGYSEDDVMGMIYMCQDIVGAKQTQQEPIPMRENWELEGIIPFEVFVKIDFPKTYKSGNDDIDSQWFNAAHAVAGYKIHDIDCALTYAEQMKTAPLKDLPDCGSMLEYYIISSFEAIAKWMAAYSIIAAKIFDETEVPMHPFLKEQIDVIESLIKLEIETGIFAPLDKMVIEANGWDIDEVKINNCTDAAEQIKAEILEQFKTKCT